MLTLKETGKTLLNTIQLYPIRKKEIVLFLKYAGFTEIKYYSNFKKDKYTPESIPIVVEAT
jgi:tRNA(Ile)-lysidine synthase TilS/MesJ